MKVVGTIEDEALCRYDNLTLSSGHCEDHDIPALNATCYRFGCLCGTLTAARVYKSVCNKLQVSAEIRSQKLKPQAKGFLGLPGSKTDQFLH